MWQLHKIFVTVQYLHTYRNLPRSFPSDAWQVTRKNPFQIGYADGIFAFKLMFSYGQSSKCADLLNRYIKLYKYYYTRIPFYDNGIFQSSWGKNVAVGLQIV